MKTIFKNDVFFYLLISFISLFIFWNIYVLVGSRNLLAVLPISIQILLLILIIIRNQYAKNGVLAWSIIFLIIAPALNLIAIILDLINDFIDNTPKIINTGDAIYKLIMLVIGILIVDYTRRTVKVERPAGNENLEEIQPQAAFLP